MGIEVGAEAQHDLLLPPSVSRDKAAKTGYPQVRREVDHPELAAPVAQEVAHPVQIGVGEAVEVDLGPFDPVVPPQGDGVSFHQLEEALEDGFLQGVAGRVAIGAADAEGLAVRLGIVEVAEGRGQVTRLPQVSDQTGVQSISAPGSSGTGTKW